MEKEIKQLIAEIENRKKSILIRVNTNGIETSKDTGKLEELDYIIEKLKLILTTHQSEG